MQFPIALVRRHAGTVDGVSDAVDLARSAAQEAGMSAGAYGQLCQFLPALLNPVFDQAVDALYGSVDSLRETATKLRTAATNAHDADVRSAQRFLHE
jgi:hypothetical protein